MNMRVGQIMKCVLLAVLMMAGVAAHAKKEENREFELAAYNRMLDLVHNHTYDIKNVAIADSIYAEAVARESEPGMLYALRIRFYALVGNDKADEFLKAVDEFIEIAERNNLEEEYLDGMSAKIQFLLGKEEYTNSMILAKEMLNKATMMHSTQGLYESNLLLGQVFKYRGNYITAISYLQESLDNTKDGDSVAHSIIYRDIAECYSALGQHDKAIENAKTARQWANYDVYRYFTEFTLLSTLYSSGQLEEFRKTYQSSILSSAETKGILSEDMIVGLRAMLLVSQGRYNEAREEAKKIQMRQEQLALVAQTYYYEGDFKNAYLSLEEMAIVTDSIRAGIQESELTQYGAELDNAVLKADAEAARSNQRLVQVICVSVVSLLIIFGLTYILWRRKRETDLLKASREETRQALVKAEKANAMRMHFIQNMSHEIRTPLNAIYGFTQILCNEEADIDSDMKQELMKGIGENTNHLTHLLNNIIALSDYDAGNVAINLEEIDAEEAISKALEGKHAKEGVDLQRLACQGIVLKADMKLLSLALRHLIDNAIAFTEKGYIRIGAERNEAAGCVTFFVEDTGKGIPAELAKKIFHRFYKIDNFTPGAGLGLSLCRAIADLLGGKVELDTEYNKETETRGSRFMFSV